MYLSFYKGAPSTYVAIVNYEKEVGRRLDVCIPSNHWSLGKHLWTYRHDAKLGVWDDKETT